MTYVTSVTVSPKNVKIRPGEWYENLNATVLPENADKPCVAWTSSNENVVSVSSFSGAVYGMGLGTAVVYATSIDGTNIIDCCTFTVTNNIPVTALALDRSNLSIQLNENRTLSATFLPSNATNKALTWCSDNTNVVTVNNGTLSPVSTGNAVITAYTTDGSNLSASCAVNVTTNTLVRCITVSDETLSLAIGKSKYITAEVCPTNATNKCVAWTSANPSIATVNPTSGLITARSEGHTTITATAIDGSGVTASCDISAFKHIAIERITLKQSFNASIGQNISLTPTLCPANTTDTDILWTSEDETIATVNTHTGIITTVSSGTTIIKAVSKENPNIYDSCTLNVGYFVTQNDSVTFISAKDVEVPEEFDEVLQTGTYVFVDDTQLTTALEENGELTACIGELYQYLCTRGIFDIPRDRIELITIFNDGVLKIAEYKPSELGLCPLDGLNDRISIKRFLDDLGYSDKYCEIVYRSGTKVLCIQSYNCSVISDTLEELIARYSSSLILSILPGIGDVKDVVESVAGYDFITQEELSNFDRIISLGCALVSSVGSSTIRVGKKVFSKLDNIVKHIDDLPQATRLGLISDVWNILTPTTRGLFVEAYYAQKILKFADGWYNIGKALNGFFPIIDFIKFGENLIDTTVVSLKTLDPRLYKSVANIIDTKKITKVIKKYAESLSEALIVVDDTKVIRKELRIVIPNGYLSYLDDALKEAQKHGIIVEIIELN